MSEKKEKKAAGCLSEFIFFLLAVVVGLISIALVVYGAISGNQGLEILGIGFLISVAMDIFDG